MHLKNYSDCECLKLKRPEKQQNPKFMLSSYWNRIISEYFSFSFYCHLFLWNIMKKINKDQCILGELWSSTKIRFDHFTLTDSSAWLCSLQAELHDFALLQPKTEKYGCMYSVRNTVVKVLSTFSLHWMDLCIWSALVVIVCDVCLFYWKRTSRKEASNALLIGMEF